MKCISVLLLCAWVLWGTPFDKSGSQSAAVSAISGYEKRIDCIKYAAEREALDRSSKSEIIWQYACLPDTINLKNPK